MFRRLSIRHKVSVVMLAVVGLVVGLTIVGVLCLEAVTFKQRAEAELRTLASAVGGSVNAAVLFEDRAEATRVLDQLRADRRRETGETTEVHIVNLVGGEAFVSVPADARLPTAVFERGLGTYAERAGLWLVTDLRDEKARPFARVALHSSLNGLRRDARRLLWLLVGMTFFTVAVASLLGRKLQHALTVPISSLARTVQEITAAGDQALRVPKVSEDEVGQLGEQVNRMLDALAREKTFSDTVIESLPGVFYICDETGRLVRWSSSEKEVTGFSSAELAEKSLAELFKGDRETVSEKLREVFETGRGSLEASLVTKSGAAVPFYLTALRMVIEERRFLVGLGLDISERKRLEQQLLHSQKLEAVGVLAGGVAHDFNNILSAILGYATLLQLKMAPEDPLRHNAEQILLATERAAVLTKSLLAFSRKQTIAPEKLDLNDLIYRFHKILVRIVGEDVEFKLNLVGDRLVVNVDRGQFEQVLMNLTSNARDAMPRGGKLTVSTEAVEMTRGVGEIGRGRFALISVSDTGIGMTAEELEHVFEPFYTTKEIGKGTGLGLSIVYGIVTKHNGYVYVYSEPDRGTTVKIFVPLLRPTPMEIGAVVVRALPPRGTETLLLVEDDPAVRATIRELLEEFGYSVVEAVDGEEAETVFAKERDRIALMLSDLIMPKRDGRATHEALVKLRGDLKVIYLSGYTADILGARGILPPGTNLVSKPLNPSELLKKIREVLDAP